MLRTCWGKGWWTGGVKAQVGWWEGEPGMSGLPRTQTMYNGKTKTENFIVTGTLEAI
jgi:hypothetical protein